MPGAPAVQAAQNAFANQHAWRSAFTNNILLLHAAAIRKWNASFEVPDITRYAEFQTPASRLLRAAGARYSGGKTEIFRYCDAGKVREFALLPFEDHLALRVIGDSIVPKLQALRLRSAYACRPLPNKPVWGIENRKAGWQAMAADMQRGPSAYRTHALQTDVKAYYPSIAIGVVRAFLEPHGHQESEATARLFSTLADEGVKGIPIGPEFSGVLANALLGDADVGFLSRGLLSFRFMDDTFVFGAQNETEDALAIFDRTCAELGVFRSIDKTKVHVAADALRAARSTDLSFLNARVRAAPRDVAKHELQDRWRAMVDGDSLPERRDLNWMLAVLARERLNFAVDDILARPELIARSPQKAMTYLGAVKAFQDARTVSRVLDACEAIPGLEREGAVVHAMQLICEFRAGRGQVGVGLRAVLESIQAPTTRAWVLRAIGTIGHPSRDDLVGILDDEREPLVVRRAAAIALKDAQVRRWPMLIRERTNGDAALEDLADYLAA